MPYRTRALDALEDWRRAERRLAVTPRDAPDFFDRVADVQRAHAAYSEAERIAKLAEPRRENTGTLA